MCGHNSVVEYKLPKLGVASSNLVARSIECSPCLNKVIRPLKKVHFCSRPRKVKILTAGIHWVCWGLKSKSDTGIEQKGAFFNGLLSKRRFWLCMCGLELIFPLWLFTWTDKVSRSTKRSTCIRRNGRKPVFIFLWGTIWWIAKKSNSSNQ